VQGQKFIEGCVVGIDAAGRLAHLADTYLKALNDSGGFRAKQAVFLEKAGWRFDLLIEQFLNKADIRPVIGHGAPNG